MEIGVSGSFLPTQLHTVMDFLMAFSYMYIVYIEHIHFSFYLFIYFLFIYSHVHTSFGSFLYPDPLPIFTSH
jgi:hypothetical protein